MAKKQPSESTSDIEIDQLQISNYFFRIFWQVNVRTLHICLGTKIHFFKH